MRCRAAYLSHILHPNEAHISRKTNISILCRDRPRYDSECIQKLKCLARTIMTVLSVSNKQNQNVVSICIGVHERYIIFW